MSKNYCKVSRKWCKFLDSCKKCNYKNEVFPKELKYKDINCIKICPRLAEIETTRFSELLHVITFDEMFDEMLKWYPDQKDNRDGYEKVFNHLLTLKPKPHNLNDLYISVEKWENGDEHRLDVTGVDIRYPEDKRPGYAIEFMPWNDWISMFIDRRTLENIPAHLLVAACLYEMTWFGFEERDVRNMENKLIESVKKCIEKTKEKK